MRKQNKNVMELIDDSTGLMKCFVCGQEHFANLKPNSDGEFYRGAWQCSNGCTLDPRVVLPIGKEGYDYRRLATNETR
jgi:hypothetical protein